MYRCLKIAATGMAIASPLISSPTQALDSAGKQAVLTELAQAAQSEKPAEQLKSSAATAANNLINSKLDAIEEEIERETDFTSIELSLGLDSFGLSSDTSNLTEAKAVYRLYENKNWFGFNQTSLVRFDGRYTFNLGFGVRHINDPETLIFGTNIFYDQEFSSAHKRYGYGLEALSSNIEFRANRYEPITDILTYKGVNETSLSGHDVKLTLNMPYLYSSDLYIKRTYWSDNQGYSLENVEWGTDLEFYPNLTLSLASQDRNDGTSKETVMGIRYNHQFGNTASKEWQSGDWSSELRPIRNQLYGAVERENRIFKKSLNLGLVVSGF